MKYLMMVFRLGLSIMKIIEEKGDGAADVRLKDVDGFDDCKKEADLHGRAMRKFREKLED